MCRHWAKCCQWFSGFCAFVVMSVAALMGWFEPLKGFEWLAMPAVCLALTVATISEIAAYYVRGLITYSIPLQRLPP